MTTIARRPIQLGLFLTPAAEAHGQLVEQVRLAEQAGLDLVGIPDHPYQRRFLDAFLLIADLLARTERLRLFPDVANLPLRPPAMIAKAGASLDAMSGGRFELGLGAGGFWDAIAGMGGPRRSAGESVGALEEAIGILRAAWGGDDPVRFEGEHYSVPAYRHGPPPAHPIELWLGAYKPRMLALTGTLADGWVPSLGYMGPSELAEAGKRVDEAASAAGRDPSEVRRLYNVNGTITDGARGEGPLDGPPEQWVETLAQWAGELRVDTFVLGPAEPATAQIERFAGEVAPALRAAVAG